MEKSERWRILVGDAPGKVLILMLAGTKLGGCEEVRFGLGAEKVPMGFPKILACEAGWMVVRLDEGQVYRGWIMSSGLDSSRYLLMLGV